MAFRTEICLRKSLNEVVCLLQHFCEVFVITGNRWLLQGVPATVLDLRERFAGDGECRSFTGEGLPPADGDIDVERIELKRPCLAAALLRRDNRRTRPREGVEYNVSAARAVLDGIDDERYRLHRGVHFELSIPARPPGIDAGVIPDIRSVPSVASKLHGVDVRIGANLVDEDKFVLGAIERSHAPVILVPDAEVLEPGIDALSSC